MISKELKAQAQLAWSNWKSRNPHVVSPLTEESFVQHFVDLQVLFNKGLISNEEMDSRMTQMLKEPPVATSVGQFQPPERSTEDLLSELNQLKKSGVLNDEEYEERKSELFFQRNVDQDDDEEESTGEGDVARRERLAGMLEELHRAGILTQVEHDTAKTRIGN